MRASSLIGEQTSSCGSSKCTMLTYLAKNNSIESIKAVSDEDKLRNVFSAKLCVCA